ncbi:MAG: hypothetical protein AAB606_05595 [Patescibacteria group bacterium]
MKKQRKNVSSNTQQAAYSDDTSKASQQAILSMARSWRKKQETINHAIKAYEEVIEFDSESEEAKEAVKELFQIADEWRKDGQMYVANSLFRKLMNLN